MTTAVLPEADLAGIRSLLGQLRGKGHSHGVIALAAAPVWSGDHEFELGGQSVRVRTAPSVLAVRDALTDRTQVDWVVILTDRSAAELPAGILEHLATGRLSNLDPWPALRELFNASRQEFNLLALSNDAARAALRDLDGTVAPAPGGVLTNDHLFAALAKTHFGLAPAEYTPHHVALWSMDPACTARFQAWQHRTDPVLLAQFYAWIEARLGPLGPAFVTVWRSSGPAQLIPLGLVAALVGDGSAASAAFPVSRDTTVKVRTLLEVELGGRTLTEGQLAAWGNTATLAVAGADVPGHVLRHAEDLVRRLRAEPLVVRSDVLPSALAPRVAHFASALTTAADSGDLAAAENAWADVLAHRSARIDSPDAPRDVRVGAAALRLLRRQRRQHNTPATLAGWLDDYRTELSWVDAAVNGAFVGADDPTLAAVAHRIVSAVRDRRATSDRQFARLLATSGVNRSSGPQAPLLIEDVLDKIVRPLTVPRPGATGASITTPTASPVLIVVADGMSAAAANEVVADALRRHRPQWQECQFTDTDGLHAALAALPTVTEFSRCSLLTGALAAGRQDRERTGFASWLQGHALRGSGQVLFHKADMDAVSKGHALAVDVRIAVEDTKTRPVVACVLNDIDDALDRSDPIGTSWTTASFKHLDALLSAAANVGRTVVLVSDHGHVVERREQPSVQRGQQISARYRSADGVDPATLPADEVLVTGPRVLTDTHQAVLAVDEQLRYTGLKAGYHGGGALAEAVIPISILVNGAVPQHLGLEIRPMSVPAWWEPERLTPPESRPVAAAPPAGTKPAASAPRKKPASKPAEQSDTLFDMGTPSAPVPATAPAATGGRNRVQELLGSPLFIQQYNTFRPRIDTPVIGQLLQALIDGNGRIPLPRAAEILGVKAFRARQTVAALSQVINADGVVALSENGTEVELEAALMFEQYEVKP